jgi:Plasmid pRiA4b ORF-3-like protein
MPTSITLKVLHDIIQAVMGWFDYHLWEFTIGKQKYGLAMDEDWGSRQRLMASKVRLRDVLQPRKTDFGTSGSIGSQSPMSGLVSREALIRATLAAKETGRPRIEGPQ